MRVSGPPSFSRLARAGLVSGAVLLFLPLPLAAGQDDSSSVRLEDESPAYLDSFARRMGVGCDPQTARKKKALFESAANRAVYHLFLANRCGRTESVKSAYYYRGLAFFRRGDMDKAARFLSRAVQAGFDIPVIQYYLGKALFRLERYDGAVDALMKVVDDAKADDPLKDLAKQALVLAKASQEAEAAAKDLPKTPGKAVVTKTTREIELVPYDKNGTRAKLSELGGKMVILHFWASWCIPCIKEFSELMAFYERYRERGLNLITVSQDDKLASVKRFLKRWSLPRNLPVYYDQGGRLMEQLSLPLGLPSSVIFDGEGQAVKVTVGTLDWELPEVVALIERGLGRD